MLPTYLTPGNTGVSFIKMNSFKIEQLINKKLRNYPVLNIKALNSRDIIKIKIIRRVNNADEAKILLDNLNYSIKSVFRNREAPYPGALSKKLTCPSEFIPQFKTMTNNTLDKQTYLLHANERFSFGSCNKEFIKHKVSIAILYCKKENNIISITYFLISQLAHPMRWDHNKYRHIEADRRLDSTKIAC